LFDADGNTRLGVVPLALLWTLTIGVAASAAPPRVEFDAPAFVALEDVTTDEFRAARPGEKLLAAQIETSAIVRQGNAADLVEVVYRLEALDAEVFVFDYGPKTTLAPLAVGNLAVERDGKSALRFHATAHARYLALAAADAKLAKEVDERTRLRYEMPPPHELLVAAGTWQRQRGVFYKLRASRRESLEGSKSLAIAFAAPQNWRGGMLRVEAEARSTVGGMLSERGESVVTSRSTFVASMHLAGDAVARDAITELVAAEAALAASQDESARWKNPRFSRKVRFSFEEFVDYFNGKQSDRSLAAERRAAEEVVAAASAARDRCAKRLADLNALPLE
jgi:hypothetical protein